MAEMNTPFTFTVKRCAPELIIPAKPTPRELKPLSDIDNQELLRLQVPIIQFYSRDPKMRSKNPASVIRKALAKLLVFYYPFAGRLKEGPAGKLMVDCSSQGVLFIEAEADVTLDQFGELQPPFPCMEELLYDVPGSSAILHTPLLLIQVTQLRCGGFIFAIRFNHIMTDGVGIRQFLLGLGEMSQGATLPSTLPVWRRGLLCSRDRLHKPLTHYDSDVIADAKGTTISLDSMAHKSLFFTTIDISAFRRLVPIHQQNYSTFEVLTACLWRCYTIALQPNPEEEMPVIWTVNARKIFNPPLPFGYSGNALAFTSLISTAQDLCNKPLGYTLELVRQAKFNVNKAFTRSGYDLMTIKLQPHFITSRTFLISDLTHVKLDTVDFGWGEAAYAGVAKGGIDIIPCLCSWYVPYTDKKGEPGIVMPLCLPSEVMDRFVKEVHNMLTQGKNKSSVSSRI